jgi:hypothetical protein
LLTVADDSLIEVAWLRKIGLSPDTRRLYRSKHARRKLCDAAPRIEIASTKIAELICRAIARRKSTRFSGHFFPQWRHVRSIGWIFLCRSIESSSRILSNGLARFKEAASGNGEPPATMSRASIPFTRLTIEDCANLATEARGVFCHLDENDVLVSLVNFATKMTTKFKTLSLLITKISTGTLIATTILALHE